jgi:hypothetical protein
VLAMADVRLDVMDAVLTYAAIQGVEQPIDGWRHAFADAFRGSPVLCDRFKQTTDEWGALVPIGRDACRDRRLDILEASCFLCLSRAANG